LEKLRKIERGLAAAERAALTVFIAFMVAMSFAQVLLRHLGQWTGQSLSLLWGETLLRHLVLWVGFLGASVAACEERQFAMDALPRALGPRAKAAAGLLCHLFTVAVCAGLLNAAIGFFKEEWANPSALFTVLGHDVPTWAFETIIPIGFALLGVHYLIKAALSGADLRKKWA
jgi:TRAP-type C4-dicarboxylate transport system permease small subunit